MSGSFKIGRLAGIQVGIHYTWLLALVLIAWSLAEGYFPLVFPDFDPITDWVLGLVSALLLFASVLVHELSHSVVATARGLKVHSITLFIFGGIANIVGEPRTPKDEFAISVVGPLTSLALAGCFWVLAQVLGPGATPAIAVTEYLAFVNLALGVFNLVPGFPLDGGRVFRSIVWAVTHNLRRATRIASIVGQAFGFVLIGWGIVQLFGGDYLGGVWTAFLGWFLNTAAEATRHEEALRASRPPQPEWGVSPRSVSADSNLSPALELLADRGVTQVWIVEDGRIVGLLTRAEPRPTSERTRSPAA